MCPQQRPVLLIHGVNSVGEWQESVEHEIRPHFRAERVKYRHYRRAGFLKAFLPSLGRQGSACRILRKTYNTVLESTPSLRPHLIAHSYGTVLSAREMKTTGIEFGRVIFAGSPLPSNYSWEKVFTANTAAFEDLRNEHAESDRTIRLANLAQWFRRGLGGAGAKGFRGPLVHDLVSAEAECSVCTSTPLTLSENRAVVHNAPLSQYAHSDHFASPNHVRRFWLPYLWGIEPAKYNSFLRLCREANDFEQAKDYTALSEAETELSGLFARWGASNRLPPMLLKDYIRRVVDDTATRRRLDISRDRTVPLAMATVWRRVASAQDEWTRRAVERDAKRLNFLRPSEAIRASVIDTLEVLSVRR